MHKTFLFDFESIIRGKHSSSLFWSYFVGTHCSKLSWRWTKQIQCGLASPSPSMFFCDPVPQPSLPLLPAFILYLPPSPPHFPLLCRCTCSSSLHSISTSLNLHPLGWKLKNYTSEDTLKLSCPTSNIKTLIIKPFNCLISQFSDVNFLLDLQVLCSLG